MRSGRPQAIPKKVKQAYKTSHGRLLHARIEDALEDVPLANLEGKVNLIITSPPFPLVRKKRYGNETGEAYLKWLESLAKGLAALLAPDGSIVIEIGNAWEEGAPIMSTLPLEALLAFKKSAGLHLCQHIICHNPARLPSPTPWVNLKRARLKDSFTHVWWMSKNQFPKADNRHVLNPYRMDMKKLLKSQKYNAGVRPSGHVISEKGFLTDHGGALGPNVIDLTGEHYPKCSPQVHRHKMGCEISSLLQGSESTGPSRTNAIFVVCVFHPVSHRQKRPSVRSVRGIEHNGSRR